MNSTRLSAVVAALAGGLLVAPSLALAQAVAPFAACPSLDAIQAAGGVPSGASFPCLGIATFGAGTDATSRGNVIAGAGAIARFDLGRIDGAAVLVPNARALSGLAALMHRGRQAESVSLDYSPTETRPAAVAPTRPE